MRKKINFLITFICLFCLFIGGAAADAANEIPAIVLVAIGVIGLGLEGFYWRSIYER